MLKVDSIEFCYEKDETILDNISFEVKSGEILAILGKNGVGKTTLLKCIMQFLKPQKGNILLDGNSVQGFKNSDFWRVVSYVPQARSLTFNLTVLDFVTLGRTLFVPFGHVPSGDDFKKSLDSLEELGISHLANKLCNNLSHGQMQLALIARALVKDPKVLILDEPESGLDMKNQIKVLETLERLSTHKHLTIIMNTHFPAHALRYAQKTLFIGNKSFLFGETNEIITTENIKRFFGVSSEFFTVNNASNSFQAIVPISIYNN